MVRMISIALSRAIPLSLVSEELSMCSLSRVMLCAALENLIESGTKAFTYTIQGIEESSAEGSVMGRPSCMSLRVKSWYLSPTHGFGWPDQEQIHSKQEHIQAQSRTIAYPMSTIHRRRTIDLMLPFSTIVLSFQSMT